MAAALRAKSSRTTSYFTLSEFRFFILDHIHTVRTANFQTSSRSKLDDYISNTTYHSPVSIKDNFFDKGHDNFEYLKGFNRRINISSAYGSPPEVWQPPGDEIVVRPGVKFVQVPDKDGVSSGGSSGGFGGKDESWGGSNMGNSFPTPKEIFSFSSVVIDVIIPVLQFITTVREYLVTLWRKGLLVQNSLPIRSLCTVATPKAEMESAPSQAEAVIEKNYQDDLEKIGLRIKQHKDRIKFLRTQKNIVESSIRDMQVTIGKYHTSTESVSEKVDAQIEEETSKYLNQGKSAAWLICQLKAHRESEVSDSPRVKDVLGIVATLGKVDDENLGRLLAEYLGKEAMMAIVYKTFDGVKDLDSYDKEGITDRNSGLHGIGSSFGRLVEGQFRVICLNGLIPYVGEFVADDPQRRLDLIKPKFPGGETPCGFVGYAVNLVHIDNQNLFCVTSSGHGLRETLFYHLFSQLQVYRTEKDMQQALPCIKNGAVSLDGGMIRSPFFTLALGTSCRSL
ncbi:protein DEFECTIVE IN MERISTEM SILENCING 3-like [Heracleum sosnowskyi]|uniref:Protein DEFECTIVE IN MERISTEM SILENCING 3-like n=1 Tax=Heracleum sosnowskyi TaxID=360622 RepID=A0AAD8N879_9APIA|nr:protein DEFECTIVE IN MERISTEM SILENCING 3-like [Heracleum sosnowskyi]